MTVKEYKPIYKCQKCGKDTNVIYSNKDKNMMLCWECQCEVEDESSTLKTI